MKVKKCKDCGAPTTGTWCKPCGYKNRVVPIWNKGLKGIHLSPKTEFRKGQEPWNKGKSSIYWDSNIGYYKIRVNGKEVKYHRFVMEQKLGRKLLDEEVVHHIDNDKTNNSIDNLELFPSKSEHLKFHWTTTRRENE